MHVSGRCNNQVHDELVECMVSRRRASFRPSPFPFASYGQSVLWVSVQSVSSLDTVVSARLSLLVFLSLFIH